MPLLFTDEELKDKKIRLQSKALQAFEASVKKIAAINEQIKIIDAMINDGGKK